MDRTDVVIFTGGDDAPVARPLPSPALVIAADSGLDSAAALGLEAAVLIGDMDSVDPTAAATAEAAGTVVERHPVDKDATDLELALDAAAARGATHVTIVGGAGFDRLDHLLANAQLVASERFANFEITWLAAGSVITVVRSTATLSGDPGSLVSLIAVGGDATGVTTEGLRWALDDATLPSGSTRGVSNALLGEQASVSLTGGTLLAVQPVARI
jgi:thiamine pyrophosphokinase